MAAQMKAIRSRFVNLVTTVTQTEDFVQVGTEARDGIGVQPAGHPEMFVENRFKIAGDDRLRDGLGVFLATAREGGKKERPVQIGAQAIPTGIEQIEVTGILETGFVKPVKRPPQH